MAQTVNENLNAEFIIKSLEYFIEDECASRTVVHDALDLITSQEQRIKELAEEVESLGAEKEHLDLVVEGKLKRTTALEKQVLKLTEENERLHATCTEFERKCASLNDENERLRASSIDYRNIPYIIAEAKADTVRKMKERLRKEAYPFPCAIGVEYAVPICKIDQIAKEMLKENKS